MDESTVSARLTHEAFLDQLHTQFHLQEGESVTADLELTDVSALLRTDKQEAFSITFRGPAAFVLEQRIRQLEHAQMGAFDIFLVPVARDGAGVYYEAVFNRLL